MEHQSYRLCCEVSQVVNGDFSGAHALVSRKCSVDVDSVLLPELGLCDVGQWIGWRWFW
jgi:hypothetical protein